MQANKKVQLKQSRSGTFTDNMKLPLHRWFRYSAGFSAEWVKQTVLDYEESTNKTAKILDPFAGSGTTLIAADEIGRPAVGFESHPFVYRIARAKTRWDIDISEFSAAIDEVLTRAKASLAPSERHDEKSLLGKCFTNDALAKLDSLKNAYEELKTDDPVWELVWLCLTSVLRPCSGVGTAQWQYILPKKQKSKVLDPFDAIKGKAEIMNIDMEIAQTQEWARQSDIVNHDIRDAHVGNKCNLLITSPPYPNNYDYADATRLEMMFWGEIEGWKDLQSTVRKHLIRACSHHAAGEKLDLDTILEQDAVKPIETELRPVCEELSVVRLSKGGKKAYHLMIAAYFFDLARIFANLRSLMESNSQVCFVIGDSAPYGVHVPAERWLGELALSAGFNDWRFEKLRDRNVKWKNRTHTVPLHEGRLWIKG